jgi:hypothetical protein
MQIIQFANLALRFILELAALGAFGYWGFKTGSNGILQLGLGIGGPLLAAVFWGTFEAPRAAVKLSAPVHLILALAFFGLAVASLYKSGQPSLAQTLGLVFVINQILLLVWKQ